MLHAALEKKASARRLAGPLSVSCSEDVGACNELNEAPPGHYLVCRGTAMPQASSNREQAFAGVTPASNTCVFIKVSVNDDRPTLTTSDCPRPEAPLQSSLME